MEEYFDDDYFELEEENNPITEFIDKLKNSVKSEIKTELEEKDVAISHLIEDLDKLKAENKSLQEKLNTKSALENIDKFAYNFLSNSKKKFKTLDTAADKSVFIKRILSDVFETGSYDAFAHDRVDEVPLWLLAVVTFDKNTQEVLDVLEMYGVDFPKEVRSIRLPQYWSNNDLKTFIDTISNHYVCNGCIYENNLQFWKNFSLYDAKTQCNHQYSEIPWQLVLSNYNWHNWELLEQIGKVMFSRINGQYFAKMFTVYQSNWSDDEIRTVIKNIPDEDLKKFKFNSSELNAFIEKYIEYFDEDTKIRAVKSLYSVYTNYLLFIIKSILPIIVILFLIILIDIPKKKQESLWKFITIDGANPWKKEIMSNKVCFILEGKELYVDEVFVDFNELPIYFHAFQITSFI